jgi:hypothetical protein
MKKDFNFEKIISGKKEIQKLIKKKLVSSNDVLFVSESFPPLFYSFEKKYFLEEIKGEIIEFTSRKILSNELKLKYRTGIAVGIIKK